MWPVVNIFKGAALERKSLTETTFLADYESTPSVFDSRPVPQEQPMKLNPVVAGLVAALAVAACGGSDASGPPVDPAIAAAGKIGRAHV